MKLLTLGTGTCVPNIGSEWRSPPAFLVTLDDGTRILFDCSQGTYDRLIRNGIDPADIHYICLSHPHPDHNALVHYIQTVAVRPFWDTVARRPDKIWVYGPRELKPAFVSTFLAHNPERIEDLGKILAGEGKKCGWPNLEFVYREEVTNRTGKSAWELIQHDVYHAWGNCPAVAFKLACDGKVFVYSGDTGYCPGILSIVGGADTFLCECSARIGDTDSPGKYGHLNPHIAGKIAMQGGVARIIFFHYTGLDSDDEIIANCKESGFKGEIVVGKDNQTFDI